MIKIKQNYEYGSVFDIVKMYFSEEDKILNEMGGS